MISPADHRLGLEGVAGLRDAYKQDAESLRRQLTAAGEKTALLEQAVEAERNRANSYYSLLSPKAKAQIDSARVLAAAAVRGKLP